MKGYKITRIALPIAAAAAVLLAWPAESPGRGQVTISIGGMTIRTGGDRGHKAPDLRAGKVKDRRRYQRSRARDHCTPAQRKLQRCPHCGRVLKLVLLRGRSKFILLCPQHSKHRTIVLNPRHRQQFRRQGRLWFRWGW